MTALMLFGAGLIASDAPSPVSEEYQIKAAFLYNFARYVEWPTRTGPTAPVVIAIFGRDPFGDVLERTVQGKTIDGRSLVVERPVRLEELKRCDILFISAAESKRLPAILQAVRSEAVLTVGEVDSFLALGGLVKFTVDQKRVRFDIHLSAARQNGLLISARLLHLARAVLE